MAPSESSQIGWWTDNHPLLRPVSLSSFLGREGGREKLTNQGLIQIKKLWGYFLFKVSSTFGLRRGPGQRSPQHYWAPRHLWGFGRGQ